MVVTPAASFPERAHAALTIKHDVLDSAVRVQPPIPSSDCPAQTQSCAVPPTHDITVADPALVPHLLVDLHTLHRVARVTEILGRDAQSLVTSDTKRHVAEPE